MLTLLKTLAREDWSAKFAWPVVILMTLLLRCTRRPHNSTHQAISSILAINREDNQIAQTHKQDAQHDKNLTACMILTCLCDTFWNRTENCLNRQDSPLTALPKKSLDIESYKWTWRKVLDNICWSTQQRRVADHCGQCWSLNLLIPVQLITFGFLILMDF